MDRWIELERLGIGWIINGSMDRRVDVNDGGAGVPTLSHLWCDSEHLARTPVCSVGQSEQATRLVELSWNLEFKLAAK